MVKIKCFVVDGIIIEILMILTASGVPLEQISIQQSIAGSGCKGQTQCQRLPHEWGLGKEITETKSYPRRNSAERRLRTQNLVTR
jgi:hypothetical protein